MVHSILLTNTHVRANTEHKEVFGMFDILSAFRSHSIGVEFLRLGESFKAGCSDGRADDGTLHNHPSS